MENMKDINLKKLFLYLLIASVSISALIGIGVILFGNLGDLETKVLLTTFTITCTSVLGLACGAYFETGRGKFMPLAGIVCALLAAIVWILLIWEIIAEGDFAIKLGLSLTLLAASLSHLSLISLARLEKKFYWAIYSIHTAVWSLAAILLWLIWIEPNFNEDLVTKIIGVLSIIIAALTIITPVFHKLSDTTAKEDEIDEEIERLKKRIAELEVRKAELYKQGAVE